MLRDNNDESEVFYKVTNAHPNHRIYRCCFAHSISVSGHADAMVEYHVKPWDIAATQIIVEEAGGMFQTFGSPKPEGQFPLINAVFGKPLLVKKLLSIF